MAFFSGRTEEAPVKQAFPTGSRDIFLSVIIPAYNEEKRIPKTLDIIAEYLRRQPYQSEILVVTDGPTDNTIGVVNDKKKAVPNLEILAMSKHRGKGYGVRMGMLHTTGRIRLFTDADNSTDISHFDLMRPLFDKGFEVVICSRDPKDAKGAKQAISQKWYKRLAGNAGNLFIQMLAVRGIWDTQCGFKAFRSGAAEKIFGKSRINGFGFDIETLTIARNLGYRIGIVPAHWENDPSSRVRLLSYMKVFWETVLVKINLWRGRYEKGAI
ncbi:MAG: dolichyl-phosphate beta-glucosyltransferase [Patescibacteria group bacterium]